MNTRGTLVLMLSVASILAVAQTLAQPAPGAGAADEVIKITKAQWAAEMQKNLADAGKNVASDYTEFNGDYSTRLEGKDLSTRFMEADFKGSGKLLAAEMLNPKVQVYGDVAILSYNFAGVGQDKDGKNEPTRAKSTRVYVKQGGNWMLVHANFAPDPKPED